MSEQTLSKYIMKKKCYDILKSDTHFTKNIREILKLWQSSGLPLNDQYYFIVLLEDATETIPADNIRVNFSSKYIEKKALEEISLISFYKNDIIKVMKEIIELCKDSEDD